jgi:hypothetical protein
MEKLNFFLVFVSVNGILCSHNWEVCHIVSYIRIHRNQYIEYLLLNFTKFLFKFNEKSINLSGLA